MHVLNRSAVVLIPREPYVRWANGLAPSDASLRVRNAMDHTLTFLIPEFESPAETSQYIAARSGEMFERALEGWWADKRAWPDQRDHSALREWFYIQLYDMLIDLAPDKPLKREPL